MQLYEVARIRDEIPKYLALFDKYVILLAIHAVTLCNIHDSLLSSLR